MSDEGRYPNPPAGGPVGGPEDMPPLEPARPPFEESATSASTTTLPAGSAGRAPVRDLTPPPLPATGVTSDDRLMAALAWLSMVIIQVPIVSLVLLVAEGNKSRPFQRYHAVTSIIFWVAAILFETIAGVAFGILSVVTLGIFALCIPFYLIFFLPHVVALYYTWQSYQGKEMEIPFISDFARRQGWI